MTATVSTVVETHPHGGDCQNSAIEPRGKLVSPLQGLDQLLNRKIRIGAQLYQLALARGDFGNNSWQLGSGFDRYLLYAVTISMQEISRPDLKASDLDRFTHFNQVRVRV